MELARPGIRKIVTATDILGGPNCFNFLATTTKFYRTNPKTYVAFLSAMREATDIINRDKHAAAEQYIRLA